MTQTNKRTCRRFAALLLTLLTLFTLFMPVGQPAAAAAFSLEDAPAYDGAKAYAVVNGNVPYFDESDLVPAAFETYGALDALGRCTAAFACVGTETMPTEPRGEIGSVKPTGWHTVKYDVVEGKYLYNRCHLIGYQLTAENANRRNLITGTRFLNVTGMLPFENLTADYIKETGNHVLYRVTPVFAGDDLLARGVLMEAESVEDGGEGVLFCVFCYNVQPGVTIDYRTGDSSLASVPAPAEPAPAATVLFILNINSGVFHLPDCFSVKKMKESNKRETNEPAATLIAEGYKPCSICKPEQAAPQPAEEETTAPVPEPEETTTPVPVAEENTIPIPEPEETTAPVSVPEETTVPVPVPEETTAPVAFSVSGDADLDGIVSAADARLILRAAVGLEQFDETLRLKCDLDADGAITAADARIALRVAVGLETIAA